MAVGGYPRRRARQLAWALLLACSEEEPQEEEFTCDGGLGRFEYLEFEEEPNPEFESECTPCVLRGGSFAVEFVAHAPVEGAASIRVASDDYLRVQNDGSLLARRSGSPAIIAWADDRVLDIDVLQVVEIEDVVVNDGGGTAIEQLRMQPDAEMTLEVGVITERSFEVACIGRFALQASSRDASVVTVDVEGTTLNLTAHAPGETVVDIDYGGHETVLVVAVGQAPSSDDGGSEGSSEG